MRTVGWGLLVVAGLYVGAPTLVRAQVSVGISGQFLSLGGDDFDSADAGFGAVATVLFPLGPSGKLGGGLQYSRHDDDFVEDDLAVLGVIAEGRYMFPTAGGKTTPYLAGRTGWTHVSISDVDVNGDGIPDAQQVSATGFALGAGGGVMIAFSRMLVLDLGAVIHAVSLGDAKADGTTVPNTDLNGTALQVRVGVAFTLGGAR